MQLQPLGVRSGDVLGIDPCEVRQELQVRVGAIVRFRLGPCLGERPVASGRVFVDALLALLLGYLDSLFSRPRL
jgi:hypothetical protein